MIEREAERLWRSGWLRQPEDRWKDVPEPERELYREQARAEVKK